MSGVAMYKRQKFLIGKNTILRFDILGGRLWEAWIYLWSNQKMIQMLGIIVVILSPWVAFLSAVSLSLQILPLTLYQWTANTVNTMSWRNPWQIQKTLFLGPSFQDNQEDLSFPCESQFLRSDASYPDEFSRQSPPILFSHESLNVHVA